ncbi:MAG: type I 3-dehydroquinate dehydratase [Chthoniobacterales bacterium]|nr:type I 3-dehydroquinate dehydratase [Chthoniobacterales bacterium]
MIARNAAKSGSRLVGVIADRVALQKATRLRRPPDFVELRLDALLDCLEEVESALAKLRAPLILTARHPAEGGCGALAASDRRALLWRFLDHAALIDIELRSAREMRTLMVEARRRKISLIISSHDLRDTPPPAVLREQLKAAIGYGAGVFKIATCTDSAAQLARLLAFFQENAGAFPVAAMGMGKLGAESRRRLLRLGSVLNYAAVGDANAPGQPTLRQLRRHRAAFII